MLDMINSFDTIDYFDTLDMINSFIGIDKIVSFDTMLVSIPVGSDQPYLMLSRGLVL